MLFFATFVSKKLIRLSYFPFYCNLIRRIREEKRGERVRAKENVVAQWCFAAAGNEAKSAFVVGPHSTADGRNGQL